MSSTSFKVVFSSQAKETTSFDLQTRFLELPPIVSFPLPYTSLLTAVCGAGNFGTWCHIMRFRYEMLSGERRGGNIELLLAVAKVHGFQLCKHLSSLCNVTFLERLHKTGC